MISTVPNTLAGLPYITQQSPVAFTFRVQCVETVWAHYLELVVRQKPVHDGAVMDDDVHTVSQLHERGGGDTQ